MSLIESCVNVSGLLIKQLDSSIRFKEYLIEQRNDFFKQDPDGDYKVFDELIESELAFQEGLKKKLMFEFISDLRLRINSFLSIKLISIL